MSGIVRANNSGQSGAVSNIETIDSDDYVDASIDNAHLADDAVDSDELAAGSVDTAHIADNQVTLAKMAGITRGSIIYGDASGDPAALAKGTDTYVLTAGADDISWAAAAGGPSFVHLSSDESALSNTTSLANVTALVLPVAASKLYRLRARIEVNARTASDYKLHFTLPTGGTSRYDGQWHYQTNAISTKDAVEGGAMAVLIAGSGINYINIEGWILTDTTAGNVQFQHAQNTAVVENTTLRAGTWMSLTLLT